MPEVTDLKRVTVFSEHGFPQSKCEITYIPISGRNIAKRRGGVFPGTSEETA